ncbi:cilia- and flagella-associated protein 144 isoform X2 [Balearica regulorum gibbericeps]|uniref:cilia- and flagella-associated protein 144 isoform X2 n=1 Tax=Balearica regulorum gibbericeps TaxID=100784 RepID=UPI003F6149E8
MDIILLQHLRPTGLLLPFMRTTGLLGTDFHTITKKPMSWHDNIEEPADAKFLNLIHHAALEPTKKYSEPQTESQEIGWNTTPLIHVDRTDCRLYFPRRRTEITK